MSCPIRRLVLHLTRFALCLLLASSASAQLDLPGKSGKSSGSQSGGSGEPSPLVLPELEPTVEPEPLQDETETATPLEPVPFGGAAGFIAGELSKTSDPDGSVVHNAATSLAGMGAEGLAVSRMLFASDHPPSLVAAARALLIGGQVGDRDAVVARLRGKLPPRAILPLLRALIELAPEATDVPFLVELLSHPQGGVRSAAQRCLRDQLQPADIEYLLPQLSARSTDARLRALELVAGLDHPQRSALLMDRLSDSVAKVAWRAVVLLSQLVDESLDEELVARSFDGGRVDRERSYCLLAIAEREDRGGHAVLQDDHAARLLERLASTDPMISGSAAVALAGIGFRSHSPSSEVWMQRDVPHRLVKAVTGESFHPDFTSLLEPAGRRLTLISGAAWGNDAASWRNWWMGAAATFRARRAYLVVEESNVDDLQLYFRGPATGSAFHLLGSGLSPEQGPAAASFVNPTGRDGERYFLSPDQARWMAAVLEAAGVFSELRLPGVRGRTGTRSRSLSVIVDQQEKLFTMGDGIREPWFEDVVAAAQNLAELNGWQRYPDLKRHISQREYWLAGYAWWDGEHSELERRVHLKDTLIRHLENADAGARATAGDPVGALAELYDQPGVASADDLPRLLSILSDELFYNQRVSLLADLALRSARTVVGPDEPLPDELVNRLVTTLTESFQGDVGDEVAQALLEARSEYVREVAAHANAYVRAAAATALAGAADEESTALLLTMLDDTNPRVEAAAVAALGSSGVERAREPILERARHSLPAVRVAALLAAARLGGEGVFDSLYLGLLEPNPDIQRAAAEGLTELRDPDAVPIFIGLLSSSGSAHLFEQARLGLQALGEAAWPELMRACQSGPLGVRREAALLLAEQGAAEVASVLLMALTENPDDARVGWELAVLTGRDLRTQEDPADAWWTWWDLAPRGDSILWFLQALEGSGLPLPAESDLTGRGTLEGGRFLLAVLAQPTPHLAERARRELGRLLDRELEPIPEMTAERQAWLEELGAELAVRFQG